MDGLGRLYRESPWSRARHGWVLTNLLHLSTHPDVEVRLGLLENANFPTQEADKLARRELASGQNIERVHIEVARSRRVSPELLCEVVQCREWEVWAVVLHNPNCPDEALNTIAAFRSVEPAVVREYAYLVARAKEILKDRSRATT